ncbi:phage tail tape measure protein [Streptomyces parvulus]|uniref:phage tail tape measure protein n=1 Tax=Streptomyces parvulus TaxID=146923 RepID=UPI003797763B
MPRAASVWLDVLPSMSEFRRELRRDLEQPVVQASARAGDQGGDAMVSSFRDKMKAGGAVIGAALGAAVAASAVSQLEKEKTADRLAAQLGASGKGAEKAGKLAGSLYSKAVVDTFEEGAEAVRQVMGSGLIPEKATGKAIESLTVKVTDLSRTFDQDLSKTANAAAQMIRTGMAKDGTEALDLLTKGFQSSVNKADDFLDTMNEYSTQFRRVGLDGATAIGLMNQAIGAGARDSDQIADAIGQFGERALASEQAAKDAFKSIGLNAGDMAAMIGKGGSSARDALQITMDALRGTEDRTTQLTAAAALFGDPGNVLGDALFAIDPASAAAASGMDKVAGSATKLGDTIRGNTATRMEVLKRRFTSVFGQTVNAVVLPAIDGTIKGIRWLGDAFRATGSWLNQYGAWLVPLGIAIGGIAVVAGASAIGTWAMTAAFSAYAVVTRAVTAVTRGWAVAQGILNAVMSANPVGLIVVGVLALVAAVIVAYNKVGWFRDLVNSAWSGIKAGWDLLWNGALKPGFEYLKIALQAVGQWATWLWSTVLSPVFSAISTGARILATILAVVMFGPIYVGVKLLGAVFGWLWSAAIKPALGWIAAGAKLWWTGVQLYFGAVMTGVRAVGSGFKWLYTGIVKPVFGWIVAGAKLWWTGVQLYFGYVRTGLSAVGSAFSWLWRKGVSPAMNGVKSVVSSVYNSGIKPVFDRLKTATGQVAGAFEGARKGIEKAWSKVSGIAKKPVEFIVKTVYGKGIRPVWNKVAEVFGAPTLPEFKGFARGGVLPGQSTYKQGDDQLVPMRQGEGVAVSEAMRDPYERARLLAVNKAAMRGQSLRPFQGEGFAEGGIFGWVKNAVSKPIDLAKKGFEWLKDGIKDSAVAGLNSVVKPLISKISGSKSLYRDMISGIPKRMIKEIVGYSGKADSEMEKAGVGGAAFRKGLSWARTQAGKDYQWGGNGDPSWDCSGFVSAIESVIRGQDPHRRWATGSFSGAQAPSGWVLNKKSPYVIGITNAGVGHTAGTINGVNVESRGGDGVVVGSRARSYRDSLFTHRYGFAAKGYAEGGKPRAGEVAWVGEQGPELVRFGSGGAEVYNNRDSMRMWEGYGARGFAKGTTTARQAARKDIPGDLSAFSKSLTGSAADIAKAAGELIKDLRTAGIIGKKFAASLSGASTRLQNMARLRDGLAGRIAAGRQAAEDQRKSATDYLGLGQVGEVASVDGLIAAMQARQKTASTFQAQIAKLSKNGLSQSLISQLVEQGPEGPLVGLLAGSTKSQIKRLNATEVSGLRLATSYGRTMADAMHDAGDAAAKGFLTGLIQQEAEVKAAMAKLGASAIKAIRSKKGIDAHSPSRKGEQAGADLGAGLVAGMAASGAAVESAAARLGDSAVPAGVVPVTAASGRAPAGASLNGQRLYFVLDDGTQLSGYVSDRVDDALTDVRRAKRSGAKR